ncbi:hypothetical protein, partial [Bacillus altitudinis]|uniref:hypothetical protein n=1 Tax=Bacillus altitudinis TaxID=293387 RepID=UPI001C92BC33
NLFGVMRGNGMWWNIKSRVMRMRENKRGELSDRFRGLWCGVVGGSWFDMKRGKMDLMLNGCEMLKSRFFYFDVIFV